MKRLTNEINRGLSKETHTEAIVRCYTTYVQDLPNGTGKKATKKMKNKQNFFKKRIHLVYMLTELNRQLKRQK